MKRDSVKLGKINLISMNEFKKCSDEISIIYM